MGGDFAQDQKVGSAAGTVISPPTSTATASFRSSFEMGFMRQYKVGREAEL
jgi:hypothetical protein